MYGRGGRIFLSFSNDEDVREADNVVMAGGARRLVLGSKNCCGP